MQLKLHDWDNINNKKTQKTSKQKNNSYWLRFL